MNLDWRFFENLDEAVYVCDMETYELEYLNRRCLQDGGFNSLDEVKGKKCYEVLQKCSSPCAMCTNKYLKPDNFYEWKYTNPVLQKTYLLKDTVIERNGRRFRMELTIDVSAQERQYRMLQDYADNEVMINEGLRIALVQSTPEESIMVLLEHLGRNLKADRVYIFEEQEKGSVTNSYEWCAENVCAEKQNLQQVPLEAVSLWYRNFQRHENVIIPDLEASKETDPFAYEYLKPQNIWSLVASPLIDNGEIIGFFGVDNAPGERLYNISVLLEIVGHFILSLLRRRDMSKRLEHLSYFDNLTGLKNRHAMDEYLESFNETESIGIIYFDVMGLKKVNDLQGHQKGDKLLLRASECLKGNFSGSEKFRIGGDEFMVVCKGISEQEMVHQIELLRDDMKKKEVMMAIGYTWKVQYNNDFDQLLQVADLQMYEDKRKYYDGE